MHDQLNSDLSYLKQQFFVKSQLFDWHLAILHVIAYVSYHMKNCLLIGSESDMDIKKELHPLSHYVNDRNELINQAFKVIGEYMLLLKNRSQG